MSVIRQVTCHPIHLLDEGTAVTTTMAESAVAVTGGVDTHLDTNMAAALDGVGGQLGTKEFPTTAAGYRALHTWLESFGTVVRVGVEGSGAYGAGLARYLAAHGVKVIEVDRPNRQNRRRRGKSDPVDALSAAGPRCRAKPPAWPSPETVRWKRSECCESPARPPGAIAPRPSTRCAASSLPPPTSYGSSCGA